MRTRSLALLAAGITVLSVHAQIPSQCLEIEGVLVDACNTSCPGATEGQNEMFRFITGPAAIALSDLTVVWANTNPFLGWVQNATTASLTAQLNATITSCGWLIEPPGGIIPPGKRVLGITSTELCVGGNSFAALTDTLYLIFQNAGNSSGHFRNTNNGNTVTTTPSGPSALRTFVLSVASTGCADSVSYDISLLVNEFGTYGGGPAENDGASLVVSWPGNPAVEYVNYGCQAPIDPISVQILTVPTPLACGDTVALAATYSGNVVDVFWTGGDGTFITNGGNTSYALSPTESDGALLSFCVVGSCGDTLCDQVLIPVFAPPVPFVDNAPSVIPCGGTVSIDATITGVHVEAIWQGGSGTWSNASGTGADYTAGVDDTGTVLLEFCAVGTCGDTICTPFQLDVQGSLVPGITPSVAGPVCEGSTVTLTAFGGTGYVWSTGETSASITTGLAGTYTVTVSNACGSADASIDVSVVQLPVASLTGPDSSCAGEPVQLTASGGTGYLWSTGSVNDTLFVNEPGSWSVVVSNACGSDEASIVVVPGVSLVPSFFADANQGCAPLCVQFTAADVGDALYSWSLGDGTTATGTSVAHCFAAGTYDVTLTVTPNNYPGPCAGSVTLGGMIEALSTPTAAFAASPTTVTIDDPTVRFTDLSSDADSLAWSFGVHNATGSGSAPTFTYDSVGCYTVELRAYNENGCGATTRTEVCVVPSFLLWVPNAFTPNADGYNDEFFTVTNIDDPEVFELLIADRWGTVFFTGTAPDQHWRGADAPEGVYVWKLRIQDRGGETYSAFGHVVVLR
jgi:gliding motility-associated-like protein